MHQVGQPGVDCHAMLHMDVEPKNRGKTTKMNGEHHGKPYEQMDDLGVETPICGNTHMQHSLEILKNALFPRDAEIIHSVRH